MASTAAANNSDRIGDDHSTHATKTSQLLTQSVSTTDSAIDSIQCADRASNSLLLAAQVGNSAEVQRLIACGENPNSQALWFQTLPASDSALELQAQPIHAAAWNGHLKVVQTLVDADADVGALNEWGFSPLMAAAEVGNAPVVGLLIFNGADVNIATTCQECDSETALTIAAEYGHASVVQLLLEAGADQTHTTTTGLTALGLAQRDRHTQVIRVLEANQTRSF